MFYFQITRRFRGRLSTIISLKLDYDVKIKVKKNTKNAILVTNIHMLLVGLQLLILVKVKISKRSERLPVFELDSAQCTFIVYSKKSF